jgi:hypothetical protein
VNRFDPAQPTGSLKTATNAMHLILAGLLNYDTASSDPNGRRILGEPTRESTCSLFIVTNRLLRPGLAAALPGLRALTTPLKRAFNRLHAQLTASISQARLAA